MTISQIFLVFVDFHSFETYQSGILQSVPQLRLVWYCDHDYTGVIHFGEVHRGKVSLSLYHIKVTYYQHDFSLLTLTLFTWLRWCLSSFSSVKLLFLYRILWKQVIVCSPQLRSEELCSPSLRAEYLHKLFGIIPHGRFIYSLSLIN